MRKDYVAVDDAALETDDTRFVEQYWSAVWKDHEQPPDLSNMAQRDEFRIMRPYLAELPRGSRILDGGCGLGEWTVFLSQQGFEMVGMDLDANVVRKLHDWFPACHFVRGDIRDTGFDAGSFDAYFSWGVFEHFERGLGDCLKEAHRILRPGGWLFISVPFHNWRHTLRDSRRLDRWDSAFDPRDGYRQAQRFYQWRLTRPELQRELELHGFKTAEVTPVHKLTGVGRWLQWDLRLFRKNSQAYYAARRAAAALIPATYISHMILAVGHRR